jgi:hypothetical protein
MVPEDCDSFSKDFVDGVTGVQVEGQRGEIFDNHQIGLVENATQLIKVRIFGGIDSETWNGVVNVALAGDREDFVSQRFQCISPLFSLD